jgi:hypothetical protein
MRRRDEGMAAPLKHFHNLIKTRLIQRFAGNVDKLLDLACGRGGDLHKWMRSGIKYARGYDIAEQEVCRNPRTSLTSSTLCLHATMRAAPTCMTVDYDCGLNSQPADGYA